VRVSVKAYFANPNLQTLAMAWVWQGEAVGDSLKVKLSYQVLEYYPMILLELNPSVWSRHLLLAASLWVAVDSV
jgi:hypothetical protein